MQVFCKVITIVLIIITAASSQIAVAEEWDWKVTPYLWASGIKGDTQVGPVSGDVDVSFSDIVDVLSGGALVHLEAHNGQHLLSTDLLYLALDADATFPRVGGAVNVDLDSLILEGSYVRKQATDNGYSGFEVGVRYWDMDLKLAPVQLDAIKRGKDWADGFIGYRAHRKFKDNWSYTARGNIGAGGSDFSWNLELAFERELSSGNSLSFGYKLLDVDYETTTQGGLPFRLDVTFHGIVLGYTFD